MPRLFITGATGYIGSSVARAFKKNGYDVHALARTGEAEEKLKKQGYVPVPGQLNKQDVLQKEAANADVVVHAAADYESDVNQQDKRAVDAIIDGLKGSNKPFIYTSGVWVLGNTSTDATEETRENPIALVAWRVEREREVRESAKQGIRAIVLRPGIVYGERGGIVEQLIEIAHRDRIAHHINEGDNHWPVVHVEDLAELYVIAAQKATPGSLYHAANQTHITVRDVSENIARAIGAAGKVASWPIVEARRILGAFADGLVLDQKIDSSKARKELGWLPTRQSINEEIAISASRSAVSGPRK